MCESKFPVIKSRILTHSACPYNNYVPKCSQFLHELFLSFYLVCNKQANTLSKQKTIVWKTPQSTDGMHAYVKIMSPSTPKSSTNYIIKLFLCFFFFYLVYNYLVCNHFSSDNSGGVVVGALVCRTEFSSHRISVHNEIQRK